MSGRLDTLETRRRALLDKCEEQRLELAYRVAQIKPRAQLSAWGRRTKGDARKNPLAWIAGVAGLALLFRRRRVLSSVGWIAGLAALATRATTILRVIAQLRAIYLSYKAMQRPR